MFSTSVAVHSPTLAAWKGTQRPLLSRESQARLGLIIDVAEKKKVEAQKTLMEVSRRQKGGLYEVLDARGHWMKSGCDGGGEGERRSTEALSRTVGRCSLSDHLCKGVDD